MVDRGKLVTAGEAARILGRKPATIRSLVRRGHLQIARKIGTTQYLYHRREIERLRDTPPRRTGRPKRPH